MVFKLQSNNVIHSFWVPQLSGKMDVMPGHDNKLQFVAQRAGRLLRRVRRVLRRRPRLDALQGQVVPQGNFDAWVAAWNAPAAYDNNPATQGISEAPNALGACVACHSVSNAADNRGNSLNNPALAGFETAYTTGPNLALFGCRKSFAGGLMTTNEENLRAWLHNQTPSKNQLDGHGHQGRHPQRAAGHRTGGLPAGVAPAGRHLPE